ncbi:glycosyltransferase [Hyphomicrobium sp. xq]|uniref:Glycosyltransferase n=1 Tax=Hyphomicrobium album TaxID=2665159 RepID=A0A6I3KJW6_9HYPH|nr:glycosyltransferase family 2 protein [Hyphomicrobium album]MTD94658.1 glycosyltransferase [Hyphomicrobium album]
MTVYVLVPVFNRLAMTQTVIGCLRRQVLDDPLSIVVIDDGSTDGTAEYFAAQPDVKVLSGDGNLWWGGSIDLGMRAVLREAGASDWVALVNNDTRFGPDFLQSLLDTARSAAPAATGSALCDEDAPETLLSIGPVFNSWYSKIQDKLAAPRPVDPQNPPHQVDALSGRGTLYPVAAIRAVHGMRPKVLPHYLADYELAARVRRAGYQLLVSERAITYSGNDYGNARRPKNLWRRYFSRSSPQFLPALICFWWSAAPIAWRQAPIERRGAT